MPIFIYESKYYYEYVFIVVYDAFNVLHVNNLKILG